MFGATSADGLSVEGSDAALAGDLFATVYRALGLDPAHQVRDNLGRPMPIDDGKPIARLFS